MFLFNNETENINRIVTDGAKTVLSDKRIIELEIENFKNSKKRQEMLCGERYFKGQHDIMSRKRTVIGEDGSLTTIDNLPNNKIIDNQYKKMVIQKINYLFSQPVIFRTEKAYSAILKKTLDKRFMKLIKNLAKGSLNEGIGWLFVYYDADGRLSFKRFSGHEIIPGWRDSEHTILDYAIRVYEASVFEGEDESILEKVEVYDSTGIHYFELSEGALVPAAPYHEPYFNLSDKSFNWTKIPLIPIKFDSEEIPLIRRVKSLQDSLNLILSNFQNAMEEDVRNTILVLVNYDGENLGQFRKNLATYGAVKVKSVDGTAGDLKTLQVSVNSENYKAIINVFKKAIIENAMGYDAKDDRLSGSPNQLNIRSMYSDIDIEANDMEAEWQVFFEDLLWFINSHFYNVGLGDFENLPVDVIFNRDILINETEAIENCVKSENILSNETVVANHPWVNDLERELSLKGGE